VIYVKKIFAISILTFLMLYLTSCSGISNKKVVLPPSDDPPVVQEDQPQPLPTVSENKPAVSTSDEKVENNDTSPADKGTKLENSNASASKDENNPGKVLNTITDSLSNEKIVNWMPSRNKEHKTPVLSPKFKNTLDKYGGYFVGDTSSKVIYLTFDEGYENGYTSRILDILKSNDVKASFFVVKSYIKMNLDLVKRMVNEGHIVGKGTHEELMENCQTYCEIALSQLSLEELR
jgi:peptidoglycan-N-acetylmuramic acid deacetylase